jgi:hypothetical protein
MRRSAGAGEELPLTREAMAFAGAVRVTALQATVQCGTGPRACEKPPMIAEALADCRFCRRSSK